MKTMWHSQRQDQASGSRLSGSGVCILNQNAGLPIQSTIEGFLTTLRPFVCVWLNPFFFLIIFLLDLFLDYNLRLLKFYFL